ncbi:MAGE family protein [Nitzschia inconspicua]|uniref:MAGE family protein n=1 Tax=Nitzschia inconspicua TaxID=303405 RepID=A0A9K3PYT8_9STRA|nr:MAGE family protein [Nitzschia inconspicua]
MSRRNKRKQEHFVHEDPSQDEEDDYHGGNIGAGFTLSQQDPEPSQSIPTERPSERNNLDKLDPEAREKAVTSLARIMLFKALEREPIDRLKVLKDAGITTKDKIASAAFQEASDRLLKVFGFEVCKMPKYMENWKGIPAKYKDRFFVANRVKDSDQGTHSRCIHSVHSPSSVERGFILLVNGLIFCKGESRTHGPRKMLERDLYRLLHRIDDAIPEEPPIQGTSRAKNAKQYRTGTSTDIATPNVDTLLDQCVHWDYFIKEKASDENFSSQVLEEGDMLISMGPRSAIEIGRSQIIHFCASILGEEPDPSMLREVQEDVEEAPEMDDTYMEEEVA